MHLHKNSGIIRYYIHWLWTKSYRQFHNSPTLECYEKTNLTFLLCRIANKKKL